VTIRIFAVLVACWLLGALGVPPTTASRATAKEAAGARLSVISAFWHRGIILVDLPSMGRGIVDTGGYTESRRQHPRNFETYYHGLPIGFSLGPDYLVRSPVVLGVDGRAALRVPLLLITNDQGTFAFTDCIAGGARYRMLLDTAALAWAAADTERARPVGVTLVRAAVFSALRAGKQNQPGPPWEIMGESGHFVSEPSISVAALTCGAVTTHNAIIVERSDNTTYELLRKTLGFTVDGDVGLGGLPGVGWTIQFPSKLLIVHR